MARMNDDESLKLSSVCFYKNCWYNITKAVSLISSFLLNGYHSTEQPHGPLISTDVIYPLFLHCCEQIPDRNSHRNRHRFRGCPSIVTGRAQRNSSSQELVRGYLQKAEQDLGPEVWLRPLKVCPSDLVLLARPSSPRAHRSELAEPDGNQVCIIRACGGYLRVKP